MFKKKFNNNDQLKFTRLTGDLNPIHLDKNYAANTMFENIVVHGLNIVVWALEKSIPTKIKDIKKIKINFLKIVLLNEEIFIKKILKNKKNIQLNIESKNETKIIIEIYLSNSEIFFYENIHKFNLKKKIISKKKIMKKIQGHLFLQKNKKSITKIYPKITDIIAIEKVLRLISISRLVGIQLNNNPGVLASINLAFENSHLKNKIHFKVKKFIKRFSFCDLSILGNGIKGNIKSFLIPEIDEIKFEEIKKKIKKRILLNKNALVIGGSSGLGEITVKTLCALGANVIFTYNKNFFNSKKITSDLKKKKIICNFFKFDVTKIKKKNINFFKYKKFEIIFYYSTPKIIATDTFNKNLYKNYLNYYVLSFKKLLKIIERVSENKTKIFFPSTIYIDQKNKNFSEYIEAKKKAENLCNSINKKNNLKYSILYEKLPRILTRQSSSFYDLKYSNGFKVILKIIKKLNNIK